MAAADRYAEVLTDAERHFEASGRSGDGGRHPRALASDLAYLQAWSRAATERALPWPADPALLLKFIAHHLPDPNQKAVDPAHGMPDAVIEELWDRRILKVRGPMLPRPYPGAWPTGRPAPVERRCRPVR